MDACCWGLAGGRGHLEFDVGNLPATYLVFSLARWVGIRCRSLLPMVRSCTSDGPDFRYSFDKVPASDLGIAGPVWSAPTGLPSTGWVFRR